MMKPRKWPRPADTALDRARQIARDYRALAMKASPDECGVLDSIAEEFGEWWIVDRPQFHLPQDLLTAEQVGEAIGEKPATVRQWAHRGIIPRQAGGYVLAEVIDALANRRTSRRSA